MANALAVLDFPAIVERLAAAASTAYGEELARALTPSPDPHEVARRQALTAEVVALLDKPPSRRSTGSGTCERPQRTPPAAVR